MSAQKSGNYIENIEFYEQVGELLNHMSGELEPYLDYSDLELTLIKVTNENKEKYFTILEPETDVLLKAGNKYEFVANVSSEKNIILRVVNMQN